MKLEIKKGNIRGCINAISSKSYLHRYLIAGALSNKSTIKCNRLELSNDINETLSCLKELGSNINTLNNNIELTKINKINDVCLHFEESASTMRFFIPFVCALCNKPKFDISALLYKRGINDYLEMFDEKNIKYEIKEIDNRYLLSVYDKLGSNTFKLNTNISSQFISGMLLAMPLMNGESKIIIDGNIVSKAYINMTLDVLNKANIKYQVEDNAIVIKKQDYKLEEGIVEADWSNMAYILAFNQIGSNVIVEGLNNNSIQEDKECTNLFKLLEKTNSIIDLNNNIDLAPILFAYASLKHGASFVGCKRLVNKESNRINDMLTELSKIGVRYQVSDDYDKVIIEKNNDVKTNVSFNAHGDHRIVMALCFVLSIVSGSIEGFEAVYKSYPSYLDDLKSLGLQIK